MLQAKMENFDKNNSDGSHYEPSHSNRQAMKDKTAKTAELSRCCVNPSDRRRLQNRLAQRNHSDWKLLPHFYGL